MINLSIIPTSYCNCDCCYCYLGDSRKDKTILDLDLLQQRLDQIQDAFTGISIYGGEIGLLDLKYLDQLFKIVNKYSDDVCCQTSLTNLKIIDVCRDNNIKIGVSINEERKTNRKTIRNWNKLSIDVQRELSILSVVLPSIINSDPKQLLEYYQKFNCKQVTFIPYSPSVNNHGLYHITNNDYQDFMINILTEYLDNINKYNFTIGNLIRYTLGNNCLDNEYLMIDPRGDFVNIKYTEDNLEYFKRYDNCDDWRISNKHCVLSQCLTCKYLNNHCMADHIKLNNIGDCCCGYYDLCQFLESK